MERGALMNVAANRTIETPMGMKSPLPTAWLSSSARIIIAILSLKVIEYSTILGHFKSNAA